MSSAAVLRTSAHVARDWLATHPGGRVIPVRDVLDVPLFAHVRDAWRPQILANAT